MRQNKFILGLTGSIGTGKSFATKFFEKKGCHIIDADVVAKSLYKKGSAILEELRTAFGQSVIDSDGEVDKENLAGIVFNDREKLEELNSIVKKYLTMEVDRIIDGLSEEEAKPFIVLEAPVLFEYGFENYVNQILLITCDEELIIKRVMARNHVTKEEVKARIDSQISQEEKKRRSDYWIDNSGTMEAFEEKLEEFWQAQ